MATRATKQNQQKNGGKSEKEASASAVVMARPCCGNTFKKQV